MQLKGFFILIIVSTIFSCKTTSLKNNSNYKNEKYVFDQIIIRLKAENVPIRIETENLGFSQLLIDEFPSFFDDWEYNVFKNWIEYDDAKNIFSNENILYYQEQLAIPYNWKSEFHKYLIDSNDTYDKKTRILKLSKFIYSKDKKYLLIFQSFENYNKLVDSHDDSGLIIFKKTDNNWTYLTTLFRTF